MTGRGQIDDTQELFGFPKSENLSSDLKEDTVSPRAFGSCYDKEEANIHQLSNKK